MPLDQSVLSQFSQVATPLPGGNTPAQTPQQLFNAPQPQQQGAPISSVMGQFQKAAQPLPGTSAPDDQQPTGPPQRGGFFRNVAAGVLGVPQEIADVGKTFYERTFNPEYQPTLPTSAGQKEYASRGANVRYGFTPNSTPLTPVPEANIPGVTPFIQGTTQKGPMDYVGQGIGQMLPMALAPEAEAGLLVRGAKAAATGAASGLGSIAGGALASAVGAPRQAGEFWGSLVGGFGAAGAGALASKAGLGAQGLSEIAPVTQGMQERYAASKIRQFGGENIGQQVEAARGTQPIVPGSMPTAAQAARSPELARLETALTESGQGVYLQEAQAAQGAARSAHIQGAQFTPEQAEAARISGVAPTPGTPSNLSEYLTQARATDEQNLASPIAVAEQSRAAGINEPLMATPGAKQPALASVANAPEAYQAGAALRAPISAGDQTRQIATSRLYKALDERNPVLNMAPMADATGAIQKNIEEAGLQNVSGDEKNIYQRAQEMGQSDGVTWKKVNGFRAELNDAVTSSIDPKTGRSTASTARLQGLKRATDDAINTAIDRHVEQNPDVYQAPLAEQARLWKQAKTQDERQAAISGQGSTGTPQGNLATYGQPSGAGRVGAAPGTMGAQPTGLPNAPGAGGMAQRGAEGSINPEWSQEDVDNYREALKSHAQRMGLYWNKYISPILATDPGGDFRMPDEAVIKAALPGGDKSRQAAKLIKSIAADKPSVLDAYGQAMALSLRNAAVKDGVNVDQNALNRWMENHSGMLSVFPEVAQKVRNIKGAQDMVEKATAAREAGLEQYNHRAIQGILNGDDPEVAMKTVMGGSPSDARKFMATIQKNPAAIAGARAAAANNLVDRLVKSGDKPDARIASLEAILRDPKQRQNMGIVLGPQAEIALRRVLEDERATNSYALARAAKAGSPTAFYGAAKEELQRPTTWLGSILHSINPLEAMVGVGEAAPFPVRAAVGVFDSILRNFSTNRVQAAQRFLAKTLTSPEATAAVLRKYSDKPSAIKQFTRSMAKIILAHQAQPQGQNQ